MSNNILHSPHSPHLQQSPQSSHFSQIGTVMRCSVCLRIVDIPMSILGCVCDECAFPKSPFGMKSLVKNCEVTDNY